MGGRLFHGFLGFGDKIQMSTDISGKSIYVIQWFMKKSMH